MRTLVFAHVDQFRCFLNSAKRGFHRSFRTADKGYHCPVGACTWIDVEQGNSIHGFDCRGDLSNDVLVAALREIGHTFDQFLHKVRG